MGFIFYCCKQSYECSADFYIDFHVHLFKCVIHYIYIICEGMRAMPKKEPIYVVYDWVEMASDAYFQWKELDARISGYDSRGLNMPEAISEPIGCYCLGYLWNRSNKSGDATDPDTGKKIEFKASSNFDSDLTSFGPKNKFDDLVFLRFKSDENLVYIYDLQLNYEELGKYKANKKQTVKEQMDKGRRPHISILDNIINKKNLEPDIIFDIKRCVIKEDNRLKK